MKEKLKKYINGVNLGVVSEISELNNGDSSNHLNYKVATSQGTYVARIAKSDNPLSYANLSDEYTILKLVEKYDIGPKVIHIDLEYFDVPILIEEFFDGSTYRKLGAGTEDMFDGAMKLLLKTSNVDVYFDEFPFKFAYRTYQTNSKNWSARLEEIAKFIGNEHFIVREFRAVASSAEKILEKNDSLLRSSPREFIYNDVHPGNAFWLSKKNKSKFIDWQKVSLGDPSFMIALFARRFGHIWGMENKEFAKKVLESYKKKKQISHLDELFHIRILERAVSDMIWSVWADLKNGLPVKVDSIDENKYYNEAMLLMS